MKTIYTVEAIGALCGCVVAQHFALESGLFINRRKVEEACMADLKNSQRFDDVWAVHLHFNLRLTLMRYLNRRKFLKTLHRVDRW